MPRGRKCSFNVLTLKNDLSSSFYLIKRPYTHLLVVNIGNLILLLRNKVYKSVDSLSFPGNDIQSLKQELEMDVHRVEVSELCQRFKTDVNVGMTTEEAERGNEKYGPNALTPPPQTPGMSCFLFYFINPVLILFEPFFYQFVHI